MRWIEDQHNKVVVRSISQQLKISENLSKFLISSGIEDPSKAKSFLDPKLAHLSDPFEIDGLLDAAKRICEARDKEENVLLIGDYDVDGITSTVIIKKLLTDLNLTTFHVIPKRKTEGYGLTKEILDRGLKNPNISLVIALDCGTNSQDEAEFLIKQGIDLIVVDHHQAKEELKSKAIQVNPHLKENHGEPWRFLCTAGLAFKLVHGIIKYLRSQKVQKAFDINPKDFLALSSLGTIADLVPLHDENRIIANFGLKFLGLNPGTGLNALLKEAKIETDKIETEDIAFKIAPRINACGRLDKPEIAISLLLEKKPEKCNALAQEMNAFNEERKEIEAVLSKDALEQADQFFSDFPAVVVCGEGDQWNPGVVGIVAGKLANSLGKPCLVLAKFENEYKGSGRSVEGINLVKVLDQCKQYLTHWGGHPAAVGLSVKEDQIDLFKHNFVSTIQQTTQGVLPESSIHISITLHEKDINENLLKDLEKMAPFGQGNPEPIIALKNVSLAFEPKKVGSGNHFQFTIHNGSKNIAGIAWNMSDRIPSVTDKIDLAFKLRWNYWNGRKSIQMVLEDWRLSS